MKYWTEEEIRFLKEYYSKSCPRDIAKKLGRSISSVHHKAMRLNIQAPKSTRSIKLKLEQKMDLKHILIEMYWDKGLTFKEMAEKVGVSDKTIYRWLHEYGIQIKKTTEHVKYLNVKCPLCGLSEDIVGAGYTYLENGSIKKRFKCNICGKHFYIKKGG